MAYFHCLIGGGSSGGGYELTVTCDADFAGTTITATDGVTTLTATCPSASPYEVVFEIPNGGEWTVSGVIGSASYSASVDIPDSLELHSTPEGATVLPTDDIQTWLACAGITDKSYTTLAEVLADSTTLLALMSNNNAVDYLVRSTTWASGITADSTAMTDIGANNYCANTLLADSTWLNAICNSTYFESVLNVKVPVMTSNTTPSGVASGTSSEGGYQDYYHAFDGNDSTTWWSNSTTPSSANQRLIYEFPTSKVINKAFLLPLIDSNGSHVKNYKIEARDNTTDEWTTLSTGTYTSVETSGRTIIFENGTAYKYYSLYVEDFYAGNYVCVSTLQFYGRDNV